jgi:ubiquinone/menaquinone biosynthesis C-methylase UbiE
MNHGLARGLCYRSPLVYDLLTLLKLKKENSVRFKIAASYLKGIDSVLDICSGCGRLRDFLPRDIEYTAIDASDVFFKILLARAIRGFKCDICCDKNIPYNDFDAAVMIISFCQFDKNGKRILLEHFKRVRKKVVIIEELVNRKRKKASILQRVMNYLCCTGYSKDYDIMTFDEFSDIMLEHGYVCRRHSKRYAVGYYENT